MNSTPQPVRHNDSLLTALLRGLRRLRILKRTRVCRFAGVVEAPIDLVGDSGEEGNPEPICSGGGCRRGGEESTGRRGGSGAGDDGSRGRGEVGTGRRGGSS